MTFEEEFDIKEQEEEQEHRDLVGVKNEVNALAGIIDPDNQEYSFEYNININGTVKTGVFIARYPSLADHIKIGVLKAKALDGVSETKVDTRTKNLVYFLAYLKTLLVKTPSWFKLEQLTEIDEIIGLYEVVEAWIDRFHNEFLTPRPVESSGTATSQETMANSENTKDVSIRQETSSIDSRAT